MSEKNMFLCCIRGVLISLGVALGASAVLSAVCMAADDPVSHSGFGYAVLLVCSALCGYISGKRYGKSRVLCGLISGTVYTACILCTSVLAIGEGIAWILPLLSVICSVAGGFAGGMGVISSSPKKFKPKSSESFKSSGFNKSKKY